jgi:phage repressor protein C with HTH and peptisase S24 domain
VAYVFPFVATFGQNLQRLRERAGFKTAKALSDALGVVPSMISKLENDQQGLPETPTMLRLAKTLKCTVDELLDGVDAEYDAVKVMRALTDPSDEYRQDEVDVVSLDSPHTKQSLPVLYEGDASPQGLTWTDDGVPLFHVEEWGSRPIDVKDPRAYLVIIRGDSMEPAYRRGWRAIVSPNLTVTDGDLVCAHLRTGERLIKIAHRDRSQNGWLLVSYNTAYAPRFAPDSEVTMIHKVAYVRTMK